ncbi:MAG: hypothetical protein ACI9C1_000527 [Candidatus Aldehydirespiratoraceae bacterium]|jgi:hypothetical protein
MYTGFSMTMAGEIPVDNDDGNIINYVLPVARRRPRGLH